MALWMLPGLFTEPRPRDEVFPSWKTSVRVDRGSGNDKLRETRGMDAARRTRHCPDERSRPTPKISSEIVDLIYSKQHSLTDVCLFPDDSDLSHVPMASHSGVEGLN